MIGYYNKNIWRKNIEENPKEILRLLFDTAVDAADPMKVIPLVLPEKPSGRVVVIGAGKASARMAEAVESVWGACDGLVITRYGYSRELLGIRVVEAAHPIPDIEGFKATKEIISIVNGLGKDDFVLSLISGGGSSLLCAPIDGLSLNDKQAVNQALLSSGAPIGSMNIVRKHLSKIKGGQLAAYCYPAKMLNLSISDVPGDSLSDIASGVTCGENSSSKDALEIIRRFKLKFPRNVMTALTKKSSVVPLNDHRLKYVQNNIISAPFQSLNAARELASSKGYRVELLGDSLEGEAKEEGVKQSELALRLQANLKVSDAPIILLSGGEFTVSNNKGGVGGPNAEFALAAAIHLNGRAGISLICCDTDGVDGGAEVAGAVIGPRTISKAVKKGLDPLRFLRLNDSHNFFKRIGDQVVTGPTLTNVNDFRAFLIRPTERKNL